MSRKPIALAGLAVALVGLLLFAATRGGTAAAPESQAEIVPTSEMSPQTWRYATAAPAGDWAKRSFDDSTWKVGTAPFGQGYPANTAWADTPGDIWLRRAVTLPATLPSHLSWMVAHDDAAEVYVNGVKAVEASGTSSAYAFLPLTEAARAALVPGGENVIAVHCHQVDHGQVIDVGLIADAAQVPTANPWSAAGDRVAWTSSTADQLWHENAPLPLAPAAEGAADAEIIVDPAATFQTITGWGGCFNERGWAALSALSDVDRDKVMRALFDPADGLKLNLCRTPIGASDYAITPYSLDDAPGDYAMEHFSIARDREKLIPYIKAAMAIRPDLKLWGVPWSPPGWMKDTGAMPGGGRIKTDPKTLDALALYFAKYVKAYRAEGINLFMVMPQNEPTVEAPYPSCLWTGEELSNFIAQHLGPRFKADGVDAEIWLGTLCTSDWGHAAPTLADPAAMAFVKGVGFQWFGASAARHVRALRPSLPLMQTETKCGNHENDWPYAEDQFRLIQQYLNAGVSSYMLWNMVLDQTGSNWTPDPSGLGWQQSSPVVIDTAKRTVTYNPQFYAFRHFSSFVRPGAVRVRTGGAWGEQIAFRNPDGGVVLVVQNSASEPLRPTINLAGRTIRPTLPPHSWSTFTLAGGAGK